MTQERDFSQLFDIIYDKFIETCKKNHSPSGTLAFGKYLGHGHDGRIRAWKKGQWPSAEDCWNIQKKLGVSLKWLVTGEGEPYDEMEVPRVDQTISESKAATDGRMAQLERENADLTQRLLAAKDELLAAKDKIIALQEENKRLVESGQPVILSGLRRDNPKTAAEGRLAPSVSAETLRDQSNKQ